MKASYKITKSILFDNWQCVFYIDNKLNTDERGTDGTGVKFYETKVKAENAGKRYLKKMKNNGFDVQ